jgi:hypothetical protein
MLGAPARRLVARAWSGSSLRTWLSQPDVLRRAQSALGDTHRHPSPCKRLRFLRAAVVSRSLSVTVGVAAPANDGWGGGWVDRFRWFVLTCRAPGPRSQDEASIQPSRPPLPLPFADTVARRRGRAALRALGPPRIRATAAPHKGAMTPAGQVARAPPRSRPWSFLRDAVPARFRPGSRRFRSAVLADPGGRRVLA